MTNLAETQRAFQQAIVSTQAAVPAGLAGGHRETVERMFGIYRHAYWTRLVDSLGVDFPGLKILLGDEEFAGLAREYLAANPSTYRSIRWVGTNLAKFATQLPRYADDPWVGDMARMDWAIAKAFDAADQLPISVADVAVVPPEYWGGLRLKFHPSVSAFSVSTPVAATRAALLGEPGIRIDRATREFGTVMTWRFGLDIKYRELQADEAQAQQVMAGGGSFAQMCECLTISKPTGAAERAAEILRGWLEWGVLGSMSHEAVAST